MCVCVERERERDLHTCKLYIVRWMDGQGCVSCFFLNVTDYTLIIERFILKFCSSLVPHSR